MLIFCRFILRRQDIMPFNLAYNRQTMNGMPIILSCYGAAVDNLLLLTGCDFGFFFPVFFPVSFLYSFYSLSSYLQPPLYEYFAELGAFHTKKIVTAGHNSKRRNITIL